MKKINSIVALAVGVLVMFGSAIFLFREPSKGYANPTRTDYYQLATTTAKIAEDKGVPAEQKLESGATIPTSGGVLDVAIATTSAVQAKWGTATPTIAVPTANASSYELLVQADAPHAQTGIQIFVEASKNRIDWYSTECSANPRNVLNFSTGIGGTNPPVNWIQYHATGTQPAFSWTPGAAGTTTQVFSCEALHAPWTRFRFVAGTTTNSVSRAGLNVFVGVTTENN